MGVPPGLAEQLAVDDKRVGLRIYLLDNSGSMNQCDGHVMRDVGNRLPELAPSRRWDEVCAMALDHARWNLSLGVPCEFVILNALGRTAGQPTQEGVDYVAFHKPSDDPCVLEEFLQRNPPRGVTPIADRLAEIRRRIAAEAQSLAARGQVVFVTIATDGLPTSGQSGMSTDADRDRLVLELRRLVSDLPVQLVIRLCTDDDSVVKFYDRIDQEVELPMDVLDDLTGEAKQIAAVGNDWFVYTPLLHRIREAGTLIKLFDDVDERPFGQVEARRLVQLLCPEPNASAALACADTRSFLGTVGSAVASARRVFDPISGQMRPFVNMRRLRMLFGAGGGVLACFAWCS